MSTLPSSELKRSLQASKYRILGLIGRGQFGRVYCAVHRKTERLVALKALDHDRAPTHKFLRELHFLLRLQHPNIVTFEAIEHIQGGRFLVMDYCEGGTLRNLIETHDRLHPALSVQLVSDILTGIDHAHQQGIVHCDIKPENILLQVQPEGWIARISDFGISRFNQELMPEAANLTGSPAYMAPERFYGQYSQSTDLYAIGVLLYELLVGHRPFSGLPTELRAAHLNQAVEVPRSIPVPLQTVILTALQKLRARRFQSASQMLEALQLAVQRSPEFKISKAIAVPLTIPTQLVPILREEKLSYQVERMAIAEVSPLPEYDRYLRRSAIVFLSEPKQGIHSRFYPQGLLNRSFEEIQILPLTEAIQDLMVCPKGCFAITQRSLFLLSETPKLITQWHQPSQIAIEPQGRWMAVMTTNASNAFLGFCKLPEAKFMRQPIVCNAKEFLLIALNSRHVAVFSRLQDKTSVQVWNRRGQAIAALDLPVTLNQVIQTPKPYCLVATESNFSKSLLLICLQPLQLTRIAIDIVPKFVTAFSWGLVVGDSDGHFIAIDYEGRPFNQFQAPEYACAVANYGETSLLIASWHQDQGHLYTLNLQGLRHERAS